MQQQNAQQNAQQAEDEGRDGSAGGHGSARKNRRGGETGSGESNDGGADFLSEIKKELLKDSIFVFTPMGKVIELPQNATAIDFAYAIHSDIGNHCSLAKANGKAIPLSAPLQNTQVVEIQVSTAEHPNRNWLPLVKTSKARNKIRAWLSQNDDVPEASKETLKERAERPRPQHKKKAEPDTRPLLTVRVADEKNMLVRFAKCCAPKPPQTIVGFVSRGRGIIIHRAECKSLLHIADFEERRIDAEWE